MTTDPMVLIQYVGKQPSKSDSVNPASGRVWPHPGAVLSVPTSEKWDYITQPGFWREITAEQYRVLLEREKAEGEWLAGVTRELPRMDEWTLRSLAEACRQEVNQRENAPPVPVG